MNGKKHFCEYCGRLCKKSTMGAENYYFNSPVGRIYPVSKYNSKTGNRQFVYIYTCPNYKESFWSKVWGSKHEKILDEDVYEELKSGQFKKVI